MRAGYRKFFMFAQVATLIGIGYLMTRFWEDAKKQCELYNLPQKQRFTRGYKRYKETSGLIEWKIGHIFHSIFT